MCWKCDFWEKSAIDELGDRKAAAAALGRSMPALTSIKCPICDRSLLATETVASDLSLVGPSHWEEARAAYKAESTNCQFAN